MPLVPEPPPALAVLSGPSGVGKDAVLQQLRDLGRPYFFTVTATTRPMRPTEVEGVDYIFLGRVTFEAMLARDEFLEWANVYGNLYGVPRTPVRRVLAEGKDVLIKADVQGAAHIRTLAPECILIFLAPPSMEELEVRLRRRKTENAIDLARRIETARIEMAELDKFDYVVVNENGQIDRTVEKIDAIITAERCRVHPRAVRL